MELILRKAQRHVILNTPVSSSFDTEYTDDEEGREAEERDRKINEEIDGDE